MSPVPDGTHTIEVLLVEDNPGDVRLGQEAMQEAKLRNRMHVVEDVVEAMSSHRPYRPGLGIDLALAEVERGRGSAYDPAAVDACLKLFREKGYTISAE